MYTCVNCEQSLRGGSLTLPWEDGDNPYKEISGSEIKKIPVLIPDTLILNRFNSIIGTMGNQIEHLEEETKTLISVRNKLLPKLMRGDIRVPVEEIF